MLASLLFLITYRMDFFFLPLFLIRIIISIRIIITYSSIVFVCIIIYNYFYLYHYYYQVRIGRRAVRRRQTQILSVRRAHYV